jgi:hypothetical protein
MRRSEHTFVDRPVLDYAPLLTSGLDGEGCPIQALPKLVRRKRQMESRSTRATKVLPQRVPKARKSAVRC